MKKKYNNTCLLKRKNEKIDSWHGRSGTADQRGQRFHTPPQIYCNGNVYK